MIKYYDVEGNLLGTDEEADSRPENGSEVELGNQRFIVRDCISASVRDHSANCEVL